MCQQHVVTTPASTAEDSTAVWSVADALRERREHQLRHHAGTMHADSLAAACVSKTCCRFWVHKQQPMNQHALCGARNTCQGWCRSTSHAHHLHITCTSPAHHLHITCTSHAHHMHITCTSHAFLLLAQPPPAASHYTFKLRRGLQRGVV
jgi:hypothetical protein